MSIKTVEGILNLVSILAEVMESSDELAGELKRLHDIAIANDGEIPAEEVERIKRERDDEVREFLENVE